jgi:hypothetical protein
MMVFPNQLGQDDVRKDALVALTAQLVKDGHPLEYAKQMAMATIFQADLELRNAQFSRLLAWLKERHGDLYPDAVELAESVRQEFERRMHGEF